MSEWKDRPHGAFHFHAFDMSAFGLLSSGWTSRVEQAALNCGHIITSPDEPHVTTLDDSAAGLRYVIVDGLAVKNQLRELWDLYHSVFVELASQAVGRRLVTQVDERAAINVNMIEGRGARHERHVDTNTVTGILYASGLSVDDGGELVFNLAAGDIVVRPRVALYAVFEARSVPHQVLPLRRDIRRLCVPMNFFDHGESQVRSKGLDEYVFGC